MALAEVDLEGLEGEMKQGNKNALKLVLFIPAMLIGNTLFWGIIASFFGCCAMLVMAAAWFVCSLFGYSF